MTAVQSAPPDRRDPAVRLARLLDAGSLSPLREPGDTGACTVRGTIDGEKVLAYCTDARVMGGALSGAGCRSIAATIDLAAAEGLPVIGLWHSGGARIVEGVRALDGVGEVFAAIVRASGKVPQISVVLGPAAGGAAYGPALTDLVIMAPEGRAFVTGPDVVAQVTGESIDMARLGGPDAHARLSGVTHVVADSENDALDRARRLTTLLARPGTVDPAAAGGGADLRALLPERRRRAYDVHPLVCALLDPDRDGAGFDELQPRWAANMVVGLGRLGGRTVGVLANNPVRKGGCLDSLSAEKAARFVRMCDAFGVPLLVLVDVPGYLPGTRQEWEGVVRRGAKLLHAFAESVVPRITLITRKSYGGAYLAMNSRALGATAVYAWPGAEVAVMGPEAAVNIIHKRVLAAVPESGRDALRARLAAEHRDNVGAVTHAVELGSVDEVIDPARTRSVLARSLAAAPARRGTHGNIPL